jgi:hypothetical protein
MKESTLKPFKPLPRGLLQAIKSLIKFTHLRGITIIKTLRLSHVDLFIK